jgi:hypothetical protein
MTAYSRNAEIKDLSADCRWLSWGLKCGNQARRRGRCALLVACLMAGSVTAAGEPVVMEEISVPAPTIGGAVESLDGGYESVLVDDGNGEEV